VRDAAGFQAPRAAAGVAVGVRDAGHIGFESIVVPLREHWRLRLEIVIHLFVLLFLLGTFLDMAATILICTPIFLPIAQQFGMDPVQFGVMMLINCALGLNTPPVGTTQFVGCAIGGVSVGTVMRTIWPFYGALVAAMLPVTYVPAFSLWLPGLLLR
jgi:TRAP-type C4-dicarboxylate transport system permease large subunit